MEVSFNKDSFFIRLMKTDENNQICGVYNNAKQTYTGNLDGRKVTIALVAALAVVAGYIVTVAFTAGLGVVASVGVSLGMIGSGLGSTLLGGLTLGMIPKPLPHKAQVEDDFIRSMNKLKENVNKDHEQLEVNYKRSIAKIEEKYNKYMNLIHPKHK